MNYQHIRFFLREYFFPSGCGSCGTVLKNDLDAFYGLCGDCRSFLEKYLDEEKRCTLCGKVLISETGTCLKCRDKELFNENLVRVRTLFPYRGKFKNILGNYKFRKSLGIGNYLADCLHKALEDFNPETSANEDLAWIPVPPRPGKIKKQGWDQIEYLSTLLWKKSSGRKSPGIAVNRCLKRLPSRSQKELNREERGNNLKGRIICVKKPPKTALLFDDVFTTGATLNACAAALLEGGAEKVYGLCLFYD